MLLFIYLLLSTNLYAKEITVNYRLKNFQITYDQEKILYKGNNVDLSLQKKECNSHIVKKAFNLLEKITSEKFLDQSAENTYAITIDKIKKYDKLNSTNGQFFENFHDYFKTLKVEELLSCK